MSLWLGFERVGIKCRRIILNIQLVKPIQLTQHERRSETYRSPFCQIMVDPRGPLVEFAPGFKKPTVVF